MRINVYSQEITTEIAHVEKTADTGITYHAVRMYLASPSILHHTKDDDDRSALTFWIPNANKFNRKDLADVFRRLSLLCESLPDPEPNG
jgi:hypothetical protein